MTDPGDGQTGAEAPAGPLAGLVVIDAGSLFAGPMCATLLGDYGAEVIKIEHPADGDALRRLGWQERGVALWWKVVGRNKRNVGLNLSRPAGQEVFLDLARRADVIIESFRPGTLERWNIGWEDLKRVNPGLVLLRTSGFGQTGPYSRRAGFGTLAEAMSGFASITGRAGDGPTLPPFGLADGIAALAGAAMVLMGLFHRERNGGEGECIDLSLVEPIMWILGPQATVYDRLGVVQRQTGNRVPFMAPRGAYRTSDEQWVVLSGASQSIAGRVLRIVGGEELAADPRFETNQLRLENVDALDAIIAEWMSRHPREEILEAFAGGNAAAAPVYDIADIVGDEHFIERETVVRVPDEELGSVLMQGMIAKLTNAPGTIRWTGRAQGADTDEILRDRAGLTVDEIEHLRREGVVR